MIRQTGPPAWHQGWGAETAELSSREPCPAVAGSLAGRADQEHLSNGVPVFYCIPARGNPQRQTSSTSRTQCRCSTAVSRGETIQAVCRVCRTDQQDEAGYSVHGPGGGGGAMEAAVLDMVGEDAEGIQSAKGGYHWDKRHKKYVQLQPGEQLRAGRRIRAESGASVMDAPHPHLPHLLDGLPFFYGR